MEQGIESAFDKSVEYEHWLARERTMMPMRCPIDAELQAMQACQLGRYWCSKVGVETVDDIWLKCPRGDWMLWLIAVTSGPKARWLIHTTAYVLVRCLQLGLLEPADEHTMSMLGDLAADRAPTGDAPSEVEWANYENTVEYAAQQLVEAYRQGRADHAWYAFDTFCVGGKQLEASQTEQGRAYLQKVADILRETIDLKDVQAAWDSKMKSMGYLR